jgi:hypothetical protein
VPAERDRSTQPTDYSFYDLEMGGNEKNSFAP